MRILHSVINGGFFRLHFQNDPRKLTIKQFNHKFVSNEQIMKQQFIRQSNVSPIQKMQQKETNENVNKLFNGITSSLGGNCF